MKITVTKAALLDGLQTVQNVVGVRTTLPILVNVLITADKNKVWLTTTDLDLTVRCGIEAQVAKTGATTLPVRRLFSIVRELPEGDIEIARRTGCTKVNIDTDLRLALTAGIRKVFFESPKEFDPRKYLGPARARVKEVVRHKVKNVLCCAGHAFD